MKGINLLCWLQDLYIHHCIDSNNEMINICTFDNPGWGIIIDLQGTELETRSLSKIEIDNGDDDWVFIKLKDGRFDGASDKSKLVYMLNYLRNWYQKFSVDTISFNTYNNIDLLYWLQNEWFCKLDFGWDGMEYHGIKIATKPNKTWNVEIEVLDTYLEDKNFNNININNADNDWVKISVINNVFKGSGDKSKLVLIINEFKKWAEHYK